MDTLEIRVEDIPPLQFVPPHCPRKDCPAGSGKAPFRWRVHAWYPRKTDQRWVIRFWCFAGRHTFSQQTFAESYYAKAPGWTVPIASMLVNGAGYRQIARVLRCSPAAVARRAAKIGRHCLLLHSRALSRLRSLSESIVYDHFESFAYGQDHPCGVGLGVGHRTWFVYTLDFAPHRRGGRMTAEQRARQKTLSAPERVTYRNAFHRGMAILLDRFEQVRLVTDGHAAYPDAIRRFGLGGRMTLEVHPNPKTRTADNRAATLVRDRAMFPSDQLHALLRHSCANHKRETIAFSKRHNALLERGFLYLVWRNFVKRRSERRTKDPSPAMQVGLAEERWSWDRVFAKRLFPWREPVPESWQTVYWREILTPALGRNARHALKYAA